MEKAVIGYNPMFNPLMDMLNGFYPEWEGNKQWIDTPKRLLQMYEELCWPDSRIREELDYHTRLFEDGYQETMTVEAIEVVSLCPHHLLPCKFQVRIEYIPNGKVLGLSKFARIAEILGKRPVMQEMYTRELAQCLYERTEALSVEVVVRGTHGCMMFRGAKQDHAEVTTKVHLPNRPRED